MGNDYSINANAPQDSAKLDGSRLKLRLPPASRWHPSRPAEVGHAPTRSGPFFGSPVPDAGFVLRIYRQLESAITGAEGIDAADLRAAVQATALERASILGRAPTRSDIEWALAYWGFGLEGQFESGEHPRSGIDRQERARLFAGCAHDALKQRAIAAAVDDASASLPPREIVAAGVHSR